MSDRDELAQKLPKFNPGQVVATPAAIVAIEFAHASAIALLHQHLSGDWGNLSDEDKALNDKALETGDRILSAYTLADGERIWIITDPGETTIVLLSSES